MNFSPFGGHFPTSVPASVHEFSPSKYTHDSSSSINGITTSTHNSSVMTEEAMVVTAGRYNHYDQHSSPAKYQRDSSTQIGNGMVPVSVSSSVPHPNDTIHYVYQEDLKRGQYQDNMQEIKSEQKTEQDQNTEYTIIQPGMPPAWQSIATPGSTVADYLSHLPASTLPISLHHFLKYSSSEPTNNMSNKRDVETSMEPPLDQVDHNQLQHQEDESPLSPSKKKKKKKMVYKEKKPKPKPGEIRLTTALDGSTLYCCPECHMAYPDKGLLEQHLLGHTMERRFFCDICGAGLKRKDHLTRHKQSHNPDRPYVCTVCCKAFKRKEQLTLHFVIHSGEKRHVCPECGKGFYRKDHLRKHTRSHIARRVKAELNQHVGPAQGGS